MKKQYPRVVSSILDDLRNKEFREGESLPSEAVLCQRYAAGRSTIRSALAELERLGVVERRQGAATRVLASEVPPTYAYTMRAVGDLLQFAGQSLRKVVEHYSVTADEALAEKLDDRPGRKWILLRQTRHIEGQEAPVAWTDIYISEEFADVVDEIPSYPGLIYALIEQRYPVVIDEIQQTLRAIPVPVELADALGVAPGSHALELRRKYRDREGANRLVSLSTLPSQHYEYEITLRRQG